VKLASTLGEPVVHWVTADKGQLVELRHINNERGDCVGRTKYTVHKQ